jgi:hypothetical protein
VSDDEAAEFIRRQLGKARWAASGSDSRTAARPTGSQRPRGSSSSQDPSDGPYRVEAVMRDNAGNWLVLVEPKPFDPSQFP